MIGAVTLFRYAQFRKQRLTAKNIYLFCDNLTTEWQL